MLTTTEKTIWVGVFCLGGLGTICLFSQTQTCNQPNSDNLSKQEQADVLISSPIITEHSLKQGETCSYTLQCSDDMGCRHNKCEPYAKIGELCDDVNDCTTVAYNYVVGCKNHKCQNLSQEGEICNSGDDCAPSLSCANHKCYIPGSVNDPTLENVSVSALVSAFKNNEINAEYKYKGKKLKISGTVGRISKDILGDPHIWFAVGYDSHAAYTNGISASSMSNLNVGDRITLVCTCGSGGISITLDNCSW